MPEYDIVVVGGGHNGLTAAAYFATCGFHTAVVEKNGQVGGGAVTREAMPGVKLDLHSYLHAWIQANPMIMNDELGLLSQYGLEYVKKDQLVSSPWLDGSSVILYKDVEKSVKSIEKVSKEDGKNYREFTEWALPIIRPAVASMFEPPPPMAAMIAQMESTAEGQEMLQLTYMNVLDIVNERFDDPRIQAMVLKLGVDWTGYHPTEAGNALVLVGAMGSMHDVGWGIAKGGSGQLSEALARCIKANGGDIFLNSLVTQIVVEKGVAKAAKTIDGKTISAKKALVADLNIKQIPQLCGEDNFSDTFLREVGRLKHAFSAGALEYVLSDYPKFSADPQLSQSMANIFSESVDEIIRVYTGVRNGNPQWTLPNFMIPTMTDPSRAPPGKHTMNMWLPNPYELKDGGAIAWDRIKDDIAQKAYENLRRYAPNMTDDKVLFRYFQSPMDFVRWNPSFVNGDENHLASALGQSGSFRPLPGYGDFRTPIQNLYICGPSTHTGGGVTGQSRAAAKAIVSWLGKDFDRTVADAKQKREHTQRS